MEKKKPERPLYFGTDFHKLLELRNDPDALREAKEQIKDTYKFEEGATILVTGGKHTGEIGKIQEIIVDESSKPNTVLIEKANNDTFLTLKDYAFVIGRDEPVIDLLEVNQ